MVGLSSAAVEIGLPHIPNLMPSAKHVQNEIFEMWPNYFAYCKIFF